MRRTTSRTTCSMSMTVRSVSCTCRTGASTGPSPSPLSEAFLLAGRRRSWRPDFVVKCKSLNFKSQKSHKFIEKISPKTLTFNPSYATIIKHRELHPSPQKTAPSALTSKYEFFYALRVGWVGFDDGGVSTILHLWQGKWGKRGL